MSTTTTTTIQHPPRKLDVSSSAFEDDSDDSDLEDGLAIRRRSDGRAARSSSGGTSGRRFEEMEIANWCTVCEKLIVPPGSVVADEEGLVFGRTSTIKARRRKDVGEDLDMPLIVNGQVKPVVPRKMKRNLSGGASTGLKRVNPTSRLSSTRNLAALIAAAAATPVPQPTYNIELYCSEACAAKDRADTESQIVGLASLYDGMRVNTTRRDSSYSDVQPPSPLFIGSSDSESTGATSVTSEGVDKTAPIADEFDYFRMQTEGVNNGLIERQRRRSNQSGRAIVRPPTLAPHAHAAAAASSDSLYSMWSSSGTFSEDGGYPVSRSSSHGAGAFLKPMTPLKSTFALAASPSRPSMANRSLSHGRDTAPPRASTDNSLHRMYSSPPGVTAGEFGSAPAPASNNLYSYALAFHRTPSSRDVASVGGAACSRRRDSSEESRSWNGDWDHVIPPGLDISSAGGRLAGSLGLATRAEDAKTPTQSLVQDLLTRRAPAMDRSRSRSSGTSSTDCGPVLEEAEPTSIRRKSPYNHVRLDSPTRAITIGEEVFSQASSPPCVLYSQSLPRQRMRRASRAAAEAASEMTQSLIATPPLAKPAPPNVWSWNSLEKSGAKVYGLPVKATGVVSADGKAAGDGVAAGRLFYFQN